MTPEAEQLANNPAEFIGNAMNESIIDGAKRLAPFFIPAILLLLIGSMAFGKWKIHPILRIVLIILSFAILAWMLLPIIK